MNLAKKLEYVRQHIIGVLHHTDDTLQTREKAAFLLKEWVDVEIELARKGETPEVIANRELLAAQLALSAAKQRVSEMSANLVNARIKAANATSIKPAPVESDHG